MKKIIIFVSIMLFVALGIGAYFLIKATRLTGGTNDNGQQNTDIGNGENEGSSSHDNDEIYATSIVTSNIINIFIDDDDFTIEVNVLPANATVNAELSENSAHYTLDNLTITPLSEGSGNILVKIKNSATTYLTSSIQVNVLPVLQVEFSLPVNIMAGEKADNSYTNYSLTITSNLNFFEYVIENDQEEIVLQLTSSTNTQKVYQFYMLETISTITVKSYGKSFNKNISAKKYVSQCDVLFDKTLSKDDNNYVLWLADNHEANKTIANTDGYINSVAISFDEENFLVEIIGEVLARSGNNIYVSVDTISIVTFPENGSNVGKLKFTAQDGSGFTKTLNFIVKPIVATSARISQTGLNIDMYENVQAGIIIEYLPTYSLVRQSQIVISDSSIATVAGSIITALKVGSTKAMLYFSGNKVQEIELDIVNTTPTIELSNLINGTIELRTITTSIDSGNLVFNYYCEDYSGAISYSFTSNTGESGEILEVLQNFNYSFTLKKHNVGTAQIRLYYSSIVYIDLIIVVE